MLQQSRMLFQCLCLGFLLLGPCANAEPDFISPTPLVDRINTPVMPVKTTSPIKVPMITWGGDMITLLANGLSTSTQAQSLFARQGLDIENDVNVRWLPDLTASENSPVAALSLPDVDASFMIISDAYGITSGRRVGTGNLYYDAQFTGREDNHRFLQDDLYPYRLSVLNKRDQDAFLELGLIHARGEMKAASWD